jgi:hypothetical protein
MSTTERGHGWAHQQRRAQLLPLAIGTSCPLCGDLMLPGQRLDLHHPTPLIDDPASIGTLVVHARCNRLGRGVNG